MILHKEYALRRFCEVPLKDEACKELLERICTAPDLLKRIVFVTTRDYLPNTMLISQMGAEEAGFELQLGSEFEYLTLVNGDLRRETQKTILASIVDPSMAWEALQGFSGLLHVQLVFEQTIPDWYEEISVPNEAIPPGLVAGFASFVREQVDLILWGITLKMRIDESLRNRDEDLFRETVCLYKEVLQSCFWKL